MELKLLKPRIALNKAFLKVKPNRPEIELFKKNLISLIDNIDEFESEEFHKNLVSDFLKNTYYGATHFINTKDRKDLVIHNGASANSTVGVIIEAKSPANKAEMLRPDNINNKAFQELVLYYLRERITHKNLEIKHLIATNIYEWYIFDGHLFEKLFAQNKPLVKKFIDFEEGRSGGNKTDFFYNEIAAPAIASLPYEITFTHFNIKDYERPLRNDNQKDDNLLIALFKLLSPEHLLKLPFANDSNSLDKAFYSELLHIIGLTETKEGGKKLIQRKKEGERNPGSLMESAIVQLDNLDKISRLDKPSQFGENNQERLFNVALELSITWVNRILFLKLLEAQLIKYHKGDKHYSFLNLDKVKDFDDLNSLFFSVLARKPEDRNDEVKSAFANVPYLNSSLFEPTDIEQTCLFISQLKHGKIPLLPTSVIKTVNGKKQTGELPAIEYIFDFLNAYDFASEGSEEIQEDNKRLINASVLGLIFEKINGYKDGSFFTPGFITMYMCRETIRRAVVQKFNETKGWNCTNYDDLYERIESGKDSRLEANTIVNSLKICDPAVGSGHFLVSALNEIITIKSELRILVDHEGKWLKEYRVEVENDELIVTDEDGKLFEYNPNNLESQRIQVTLFHEKQTIIENCLFGVDLNPNSVKICRLRLWIELLKNAYYRPSPPGEGSGVRLETLPNIDINIKCGNSLISRYTLDTDIKKALKGSKWTIDTYRIAVMTYRNAASKDEKRAMERLINEIKNDFVSEIASNDKRLATLNILRGDLYNLSNQTQLFELSKAEKAKFNKAIEEKTAKIEKLNNELEEIRNNKIYENAFEWRFEFPEVLNDEGDFVGFDVVIGNPPYILVQSFGDQNIFEYYKTNYQTATYKIDTYALFYEEGIKLLSLTGLLGYITPNTFLKNKHSKELRTILLSCSINEIINFYIQVFEDASVDTLILLLSKCEANSNHEFLFCLYRNSVSNLSNTDKIKHKQIEFKKGNYELELDVDSNERDLLSKIEFNTKPLSEFGRSYFGIQTFDRKQFVSKTKNNDDYYPVIDGGNINRFTYKPFVEFVHFKKESIKSGGDLEVYKKYRIVVRQIGKYPEGTIIEPYLMTLNTIYNFFLYKDDIDFLRFILSLLNSKLFQFYWTKKFYDNKATFPKIKKEPLESLPIKEASQAEIIRFSILVENVMKYKQESLDTTLIESDIDQLVYQLYGLTEVEIGIVEGK